MSSRPLRAFLPTVGIPAWRIRDLPETPRSRPACSSPLLGVQGVVLTQVGYEGGHGLSARNALIGEQMSRHAVTVSAGVRTAGIQSRFIALNRRNGALACCGVSPDGTVVDRGSPLHLEACGKPQCASPRRSSTIALPASAGSCRPAAPARCGGGQPVRAGPGGLTPALGVRSSQVRRASDAQDVRSPGLLEVAVVCRR